MIEITSRQIYNYNYTKSPVSTTIICPLPRRMPWDIYISAETSHHAQIDCGRLDVRRVREGRGRSIEPNHTDCVPDATTVKCVVNGPSDGMATVGRPAKFTCLAITTIVSKTNVIHRQATPSPSQV